MLYSPMIGKEFSEEQRNNELEEKTRLVANIERLLACQGFGGTLKTAGSDAALVERVSELLLRYAERGTRNQELVMRCNQLEKQAQVLEDRSRVTEDVSSLDYYESVKRENSELKASVRRQEQELDRERAVARKLRDEVVQSPLKMKKEQEQELRQILAKSESRNLDLESKLQRQNQELEKERALIRKLREENACIKKKSPSSPKSSPEIAQASQLKDENYELKTLLNLREQELEATSRKLREQLSTRKKIPALPLVSKEENEALRQENSELKATLRKKEIDLSQAKERLAQKKTTPIKKENIDLLQIEEHYQQVCQENAELKASLRKKEIDLTHAKEHIIKKNKESPLIVTKIPDLPNEFEQMRQENTELKATLRKKEIDLSQAKERLAKKKDSPLISIKAHNDLPYEHILQENAELKASLRKKEYDLTQAKERLAKKKESPVRNTKSNDLPDDYEQIRQENAELSATLRKSMQEIEREKDISRKLRNEIAAHLASLRQLEQQNIDPERLRLELSEIKATLRKKEQDLEREKNTAWKLRDENAALRVSQSSPQRVFDDSLRRQLAEMGAALRKKDSELEREKTTARKLRDEISLLKQHDLSPSTPTLGEDDKQVTTPSLEAAALRRKENELEREKATARKLRDQIAVMKEASSSTKKDEEFEAEKYKQQVADLHATLRRKEQELEKERAALKKARDQMLAHKENSPMTTKNTTNYESIDGLLRQQMADLSAALRRKEQELEREQAVARKLRNQMAMMKEAQQEDTSVDVDTERSRQQVVELSAALRKKEQELEKERAIARKLRDETSELRALPRTDDAAEKDRLRLDFADLRAALRKKEQDLEKERALARKLRDENAELKVMSRHNDDDQTNDGMRQEIATLKASLRKNEQDLERERSMTRKLRDEKSAIKSPRDDTQDIGEKVRQTELNELKVLLRRKDQELERQRATAQKLRDETTMTLRRSAANNEAAINEVKELRLEVTDLKGSLRIKEQEIEKEQAVARKLRDENAELRTSSREQANDGSEEEQRFLNMEVSELKAALRKKEQDFEREQATARRLRDEISELRLATTESTADREVDLLRQEVSELTASLQRREQDLEREQTNARRLRDESKVIRVQIQEANSSAQSSLESLRLESIELKASLRKREQELERERTASRRLRDETKEARDKLREAETNKEEAERQASDASKQLQRLQKSNHLKDDCDLEHTRDAAAVFEAVHGRKPRPGSSADERALDMARIGVQARLQLEDAVAALKDEILMARREAAKQRQKSAALSAQILSSTTATNTTSSTVASDKSNKENEQILRDKDSELEVLRTRPSHREMREAQRRIEELEAQLHEHRENERLYRKYAGTASLVARDKLDFSLKLRDVDRLPRAFLADIVKQLCRRLRLADVARLEASVESLVKACSAIPTLDAFARDMIAIFSAADLLDDTTSTTVTSPADCLALARKWQQQRAVFAELSAFRSAVSKKLISAKRLAASHQIQDVLFALDAVLSDLVVSAKRRDQFAKADALLAGDDAHAAVRHVFNHLSTLFEIKSLDGFIPRFTQLYGRHAELEHFKTAVHTILIEIDHDNAAQSSSPAALVNTLRHILGLSPATLDFLDQQQDHRQESTHPPINMTSHA